MFPQQILLNETRITTAVAAQTGGVIGELYSLKALVVGAKFVYGSGGNAVKAWVQTSLDNQLNWIDIICFSFSNESLRKVACVNSITSVTTVYTPSDGTLGGDSVKDGILGDALRVKYTTIGTYADDTTLTINMALKG